MFVQSENHLISASGPPCEASELITLIPMEETEELPAVCDADQYVFERLKGKIALLEKKLEDWGRRCDEADGIEQHLRLQLYEFSEKWKGERSSLIEEIEKLKKENAKLRSDLMEVQEVDATDKLKLEKLLLEKKIWAKEKKEKNDEINMLTARIIALRNELRKYAKKGGGDVSPSSAIASMVVSDNAEGEVTPTRNLSVEARLSTNCKRKPIKSASSFCASLQCQPFSLVESP
ncbi:unnamed protein product [Enterobius vermicularis]|uniref:Protein CHUP1, chloroplastic n=1 Tax=Enterobius vermicularis TaxID=51028 RepID=A0A0N4VBL7_ENTVE|nr:unnamed protein product [Enterobius vermicularis]